MNNINTSVLSSHKVLAGSVFDNEAEKLMGELSKEHSNKEEDETTDGLEKKEEGSTETGERLLVPDNDDGLRPDLSVRSGSDDQLESINSTIQDDAPETNQIF